MTDKEIKDYVLILMCKSIIAKLSPEVSAKFRKEVKVMQEGLSVFRPKGDVSETLQFASMLGDLFMQMAHSLSTSQNLETVSQLMVYLRSVQEKSVAIFADNETGWVLWKNGTMNDWPTPNESQHLLLNIPNDLGDIPLAVASENGQWLLQKEHMEKYNAAHKFCLVNVPADL